MSDNNSNIDNKLNTENPTNIENTTNTENTENTQDTANKSGSDNIQKLNNNSNFDYKKAMNEKVKIPESLTPENIEKMLAEKQANGELEAHKKQMDGEKKKAFPFWKSTKGIVTAASLVIIVGAVATTGIIKLRSGNNDPSKPGSTENPGVTGQGYFDPEGENYEAAYESIRSYYSAMDQENSGIDFSDNIISFSDNAAVAESDMAAPQIKGSDASGATQSEGAKDSALSAQSELRGSEGGEEYSDTNVRTEGVDEGDIIKTDGKYIYVCHVYNYYNEIDYVYDDEIDWNILQEDGIESDSTTEENSIQEDDTEKNKEHTCIKIFSAEEGKTSEISDIDLTDEEITPTEIIVDGDYLVVLGNKSNGDFDYEGYYGMFSNGETKILIYDISDRANPEKVKGFTQDGSFNTSRAADGILYIFSDKTINYIGDDVKVDEYDSYVPKIDGKLVPADGIVVHPNVDMPHYTLISSVDISNGKIIDELAVLGGNASMYVSTENIYMADYKTRYYFKKNNNEIKNQSRVWGMDSDKYYTQEETTIQKVNYKDGKFTVVSAGICRGNILNDYSMDEYKGYLRLVTTDIDYTDWTRWNMLYVFDDKMEVVGKLENIAKKEEVKSARFMGDVGYFVTFLNTDPLFSVDLSDPENPKIIGQLKIPGFSSYLHPYGENLLLGIGYAGDYEGLTGGIKVSMFDTSDPKNVKEIATKTYECYSNPSVEYDPKSALVDPEENIFGFTASYYNSYYGERKGITVDDETDEDTKIYNGASLVNVEDLEPGVKNREDEYHNDYLVFSYDAEEGFSLDLRYYDMTKINYWDCENRGIYIGDYLYVVDTDGKIASFDRESFELVDKN